MNVPRRHFRFPKSFQTVDGDVTSDFRGTNDSSLEVGANFTPSGTFDVMRNMTFFGSNRGEEWEEEEKREVELKGELSRLMTLATTTGCDDECQRSTQ